MKENNAASMSERELDLLIAKNRKRARIGLLLIIAGAVLMILLAFLSLFLGIVLGVIVIGMGIYLRNTANRVIRENVLEAALVPVLNEVFEHVHYGAKERIPDRTVRAAEFGLSFQRAEGSDRIAAQYRGVDLAMSDLTLKSVSSTVDEDGTRTEREKKEFHGLWLTCDLKKRFATEVLLRERKGLADKLLKRGVKTEDEAFNKQFGIDAPDEEGALHMLTPQVMDAIRALDERGGGRTFLRLRRDGRLMLALDMGHSYFESHKSHKVSLEELREQYRADLRFILDLLDALLQ